jgi:hypothetical protein
MIDFSFVGKDGIIIQFEDVVSMIGFNIVRYFKLKGMESLRDYDLKQMILDYVNREEEDYNKWVSNIIKTDIKLETYIDSINAFQTSWLYAYKIFASAYKNGIKNLMIHSNEEIPFIRDLLPTFNVPSIKYVYGDIVPILNQNPNITYLTSLPSNIRKCLDVDVPFALTIVDDYLYTADVVVQEKVPEKLIEKGIFVAYTGIFSSGFIDTEIERANKP